MKSQRVRPHDEELNAMGFSESISSFQSAWVVSVPPLDNCSLDFESLIRGHVSVHLQLVQRRLLAGDEFPVDVSLH